MTRIDQNANDTTGFVLILFIQHSVINAYIGLFKNRQNFIKNAKQCSKAGKISSENHGAKCQIPEKIDLCPAWQLRGGFLGQD